MGVAKVRFTLFLSRTYSGELVIVEKHDGHWSLHRSALTGSSAAIVLLNKTQLQTLPTVVDSHGKAAVAHSV